MKCTVTNTDMAHPSRALCTTQIYKTLIMTGHFGPRESKQGTRLSDINMAETKSLRNVCSHGYLGYKGAQILDPVCTVNACSDSSTVVGGGVAVQHRAWPPLLQKPKQRGGGLPGQGLGGNAFEHS